MPSLIEIELKSGIAILRLNRPEKRNAMSDEMRAELVAALRTAAADDAVRALVITGAGKGFCAGGDIAGMQQRLEAPVGQAGFSGWKRQLGVHHAVAMLHRLPKPTLAAVNGAAAGLGADLALACDFVVASSAASFAWSYVHRGLIPDGGDVYKRQPGCRDDATRRVRRGQPSPKSTRPIRAGRPHPDAPPPRCGRCRRWCWPQSS